MYRSFLLLVAALVVVFAAGCVSPASGSPDLGTPASGGAQTPASDAGTDLSEEIAGQAEEWLAGELNLSAEDLEFIEAEQTEWTDSCFGLGGPAESCLQAMTPGWRIVFEADGQQYEVRTDQAGTNFRVTPEAS